MFTTRNGRPLIHRREWLVHNSSTMHGAIEWKVDHHAPSLVAIGTYRRKKVFKITHDDDGSDSYYLYLLIPLLKHLFHSKPHIRVFEGEGFRDCAAFALGVVSFHQGDIVERKRSADEQ